MIVDINEMKQYLRIDGNDDNEEIALLIDIAEEYLKNAGCILEQDGKAINIAKLAVKQLVVHWYENRTPVDKTVEELPKHLSSIIAQLKYCYGGDTV